MLSAENCKSVAFACLWISWTYVFFFNWLNICLDLLVQGSRQQDIMCPLKLSIKVFDACWFHLILTIRLCLFSMHTPCITQTAGRLVMTPGKLGCVSIHKPADHWCLEFRLAGCVSLIADKSSQSLSGSIFCDLLSGDDHLIRSNYDPAICIATLNFLRHSNFHSLVVHTRAQTMWRTSHNGRLQSAVQAVLPRHQQNYSKEFGWSSVGVEPIAPGSALVQSVLSKQLLHCKLQQLFVSDDRWGFLVRGWPNRFPEYLRC